MAGESYRTRRLVLREPRSNGQVVQLGEARGWTFLGEVVPQDAEREQVWQINDSLVIHYIDDQVSGLSCIVVTGTRQDRAEELAADLEDSLDTWRLPELLAAVDDAHGPQDRARAVIRAGLGSPRELDEGFYKRVRDAVEDGDPEVREAGLLATSYELWDPYRQVLDMAMRLDPDERLRDYASDLLMRFDVMKGINPY